MDLSKLPDSQRQELEQLQKQFQEHQQKQQQSALQQQQPQPQPPPPAYDPFHLHQPYVPSQPYDHSYYYNYQHPPQQQQQQHQQQQHQSHLHQYDASYYQNYYSNSYQQHHYTAPNEQQRNAESGYGSGSLGLGHPYGNQVNPGYPGPPGINPTAAAAAVAALSQLTHFAGSMAGGGGGGGGGHYDQGHFRPPVGHTLYRGRGRRGGGPFRGGGRGNSGFRPSNTGVSGPPFRGPGRDRDRGRGRRDRRGPPLGAPSSHPESSANANAQPSVRTAWCEVCKTDCTTDEVLDQHNNGKRHKRNVQKLQRMKSATAHQPVVLVQTEKDEKPGSDIDPEVQENIPETEPDKQAEVAEVGDDSNKVETDENDNQEKKHRMKRKMKRSIRGARGGGAKRMRVAGPRIRKVVIPLVCDLCNIKCDTQEVFDRHTSGKKHRSKLRRFEGHQAMYGPTAVQALYPPNPLSHSLGPQPPAYNGASSSYPAPPEAYIPPPYQAQNPNPQLADAPLEFGTHNAVLTG